MVNLHCYSRYKIKTHLEIRVRLNMPVHVFCFQPDKLKAITQVYKIKCFETGESATASIKLLHNFA